MLTPGSMLDRLKVAGPEAAEWHRLQEIYVPMIRSWLIRVPDFGEEAQDLTQEVFLVVIRELPRFERQREGSFRTWLRKVTVNRVREFIRKRQRGSAGGMAEGFLSDLEDASSSLAREWDRQHDQHVFHKLLSTLQHACERGLVHRDIKPNNLILAESGASRIVKILDFGLAKLSEDVVKLGLTDTGQLLGTAAYMSPEQSRNAQQADIRADIYSLGCTLYFLLLRKPPFDCTGLYELLKAHQEVEALPLHLERSDVPAELAAVVAKMLAKDPAQRYQTPDDVVQALEPFLHTRPVEEPALIDERASAPSVDCPSKEKLPTRRPRWMIAAGILLAASLLASLVQFIPKNHEHLALSPSEVQATANATISTKVPQIPPDAPVPTPDTDPPTVPTRPTIVKVASLSLAITPFDPPQARTYQQEWANCLDTTVEKTNSLEMKMILIPAGEFQMGSGSSASQDDLKGPRKVVKDIISAVSGHRDEGPQHQVVLTKPFRMSSTEVTIGQFKMFVEASGHVTQQQKGVSWNAPGYQVTEQHPVTCVSWDDAVAFCNWLSECEQLTPCYRRDAKDQWESVPGSGYRLPTEAEWEFACRAGATTLYSFGENWNDLHKYAWYARIDPESGHGASVVAKKLPNAFGLYDMHGNVSEWCQDWYGLRWYEVSPPNDPTGPSSGAKRVVRGGNWTSLPPGCRSASRMDLELPWSVIHTGFRIVCTDAK